MRVSNAAPAGGKAGFIIAAIGGIVGLLSFFSMPYLSYGFVSATGQQLASLGYQSGSLYNTYGSSGSQFNGLFLFWLVPVIAGLIILIAGVSLLKSGDSGMRTSAGWLIALAIFAIFGLFCAYIYLSAQIHNSFFSSSSSLTSLIGSGIWIYMVTMVAVLIGGAMQLNSSR